MILCTNLSRPKAGFYTGPALSCLSAMMCVPDAKLMLGKAKIDAVPLSFIKIHKYLSKRMREGHSNREGEVLKMILKKVKFMLKFSNITEI